jgi:hypothetical protein
LLYSIRYYEDTIKECSLRAKHLHKKMHALGTLRLLVVVGAITTAWLLWEQSGMLIGLLSLWTIGFVVLMVLHNSLANKKSYAEALIELCTCELKGLNYDFGAFDGAPDKIDAQHPFSLDLDLFGQNSLFQSVNRTVTAQGREMLADWFINPLTAKDAILQRQQAIQELTPLTPLRQDFYVAGVQSRGKTGDGRLLERLVGAPVSFAGSIIWKSSVWIVPVLWVAVFAGLIGGYISLSLFGGLFTFSALAAYLPVGKMNKLHHAVDKLEKILLAYSGLIKTIEGATFSSEILSTISRRLTCTKGTASQSIKQLSAHIGVLDQRGTLTAVLLNIFTFRDLKASIAIERWKMEHGAEAAEWIDALARFDAMSSLAGFAFNHPDYSYPSLADSYFEMSGKALGHPMIRRDVCVRNDIKVGTSPSFLIITGANMAGKSTYLRTVGVNFMLASIGAPVCAAELTVYPASLVTSLRTSDSLTSNESYFFAELKRLKMIIDRLKQGDQLFIILDEILKGTNSVDKQKGSFALMKQLLSHNACGIIATHDLALGSLENDFPRLIKNYRFEADITADSLTFSYHLRKGVAQNMNACFLMQKMGITLAAAQHES